MGNRLTNWYDALHPTIRQQLAEMFEANIKHGMSDEEALISVLKSYAESKNLADKIFREAGLA